MDIAGDDAAVQEREPVAKHGNTASEEELDEKYPNRPKNFGKSLPFHDLFLTLFNPLNEARRKPTGPKQAWRKTGRYGAPQSLTPHEMRRSVIERFISKWRRDVGNDIYPALRLIVPDKDRERPMYGLKEKMIGKLLVQIVGINKDSDDAQALLNWKIPGQKYTSTMAGDFAGRCQEILSKRASRTKVGEMTVVEVNEQLDRLSEAGREEHQRPILENFYNRMNAEEMMWLIRIILRQMKIGATERTLFNLWHPDADTLFNVSSNLRRVCWELYDPQMRLESEETDVNLMQCFQPQLAQFQMQSHDTMIKRMRLTEEDEVFWIEEKLDGERMQLHMMKDDTTGKLRFAFWSRRAKEYTYLYGNSVDDDNSALTRHLRDAFDPNVRNIILDGEMITWNYETDKIVGFGTLKSAAIEQQKNPYASGDRPVYKIFDILYLNDKSLTRYTLRDRRKALEASVRSVHRRMEIHTYQEAHTSAEIDTFLRQVVAEASEGLVAKNPNSMYHLNQRNNDWVKVKPEYTTEYGEALDFVVIGGYYGSGRRGGTLSSFLCGLRVERPGSSGSSQVASESQASPQSQTTDGKDKVKFWSFFKVGGGMTASDYSSIRHLTDGKWHKWDPNRPPVHVMELAGGDKQFERPDMWIDPRESIVVSVKYGEITGSPQFRMGLTLRFPRFKSIRSDKDWSNALSVKELNTLRHKVSKDHHDKALTIDQGRRAKRPRTGEGRKPLTVAGFMDEEEQKRLVEMIGKTDAKDGVDLSNLFQGLNFYILSGSKSAPRKCEKAELEALIKHHGGKVFARREAADGMICIGDSRTVQVASIVKSNACSIVRPLWLFHCIEQAKRDSETGRECHLVPYEPRHMFYVNEEDGAMIGDAADEWHDGYARDVKDVDELRELLNAMPSVFPKEELENGDAERQDFLEELESRGEDFSDMVGWVFKKCVAFLVTPESGLPNNTEGNHERDEETKEIISRNHDFQVKSAKNVLLFGGGRWVDNLDDPNLTHVVTIMDSDLRLQEIRRKLSRRLQVPRVVTLEWIQESWAARTRLDAERFLAF